MPMNDARTVKVTPANTSREQDIIRRNYNYGYNVPLNYAPAPMYIQGGGNIDKILQRLANQFGQAAPAPAQTTTGGGFDLNTFVSNNKWLLIGGAGLLAYFMFFGGGLGATDKTVTSVTRFGRKS